MTREDASNILHELKGNGLWFSQRLAIDMAIEALKQPERKKGKWIEKGVYIFECSNCGDHVKEPLNYCSNCGAEMEE